MLTWDCLTSLAWSLAITLKCLSNLFVFDSLLLPLTLMQDLCHLPAWLLRLHFAARHETEEAGFKERVFEHTGPPIANMQFDSRNSMAYL